MRVRSEVYFRPKTQILDKPKKFLGDKKTQNKPDCCLCLVVQVSLIFEGKARSLLTVWL